MGHPHADQLLTPWSFTQSFHTRNGRETTGDTVRPMNSIVCGLRTGLVVLPLLAAVACGGALRRAALPPRRASSPLTDRARSRR